jgi:hypothetical protein
MRDPELPTEILLFNADEKPEERPCRLSYGQTTDRIIDGLIDIVLAADDVLRCLDDEAASPFLWAEPHLRRVLSDADTLLKRLTN